MDLVQTHMNGESNLLWLAILHDAFFQFFCAKWVEYSPDDKAL